MSKLFRKIAEFMQDRYGNDKLNTFLLTVAAILYIINIFARSSIMIVIIMLLIFWVIFRALSKNITKRLYENRRFTDIFGAVADFFKRQPISIGYYSRRGRGANGVRKAACSFCK